MNIKSTEAHRLARQITALTGESQTTAVTIALQERLQRLQQSPGLPLYERLLAIGRDCSAHLSEPYRSIDHDELLYNECGLPQ